MKFSDLWSSRPEGHQRLTILIIDRAMARMRASVEKMPDTPKRGAFYIRIPEGAAIPRGAKESIKVAPEYAGLTVDPTATVDLNEQQRDYRAQAYDSISLINQYRSMRSENDIVYNPHDDHSTDPTSCKRCRHPQDFHREPLGDVQVKYCCIGSNCTCHCPGYNDITTPTPK